MPPPRSGPGSDPLDPFPPLPSSRRAVMNSRRSYASILRPAGSGNGEAPRSQRASRGSLVWDVDDVEGQEALDELRSWPGSPAVFTVASPPRPSDDSAQPPWRAAETSEEDQVLEPDERPSRPDQDYIAPSVISPSSAHRPDATSTTRLAPIFTLDELLGQNRDAQRDNPDATPAQPTADEGRADRVLALRGLTRDLARTRSANAGAGEAASADVAASDAIRREVDHARRTWQGGIEAANRLGYDQARSRGGLRVPQPPFREVGNDAGSSSIPLRRRGRRLFPPSDDTEFHAMLEGDEEFYRRATAQLQDDESDHLENALLPRSSSGRSVRPFYSHPNITGDIDLDEWSGAFGTGLRRGGNNRRRDSLQQRIDPEREPSIGAEEVMPLLGQTAHGLDPTNIESLRIAQPIIVRTGGNRRQRSLSEGSVPDKRLAQGKRRKFTAGTLPPSRPEYLSITSLRPSTPLPDDFEKPTRNSFLDLSHSTTGRPIIKFCNGPRVTETDDDASALRANRAIPVECGVYYYEVECLNKGHEGFMSVGWMLKSTSLHRLVGWDKGTWGWHADDGMSFNQSGSGDKFADRWSTGDTVGCGVDFTSGRAFFTKNGKMMGHRFNNLGQGLYPAVGLRTRDEELCINFTGPFRFDIEAYLREARDNVEVDVGQVAINKVPRLARDTEGEEGLESTSPVLPASSRTTAAFVLDFLKHNGYTKAFDSAREEMSRRSWIEPVSAESRGSEKLSTINEISRVLSQHQDPVPLKLIGHLVPDTAPLQQRMSIYQLVYLVQSASDEDQEMEAISFGRELRQRAKQLPWAQGESYLLDEAVGHLGLQFDEASRIKWTERRSRDTELLDSHLRSVSGLRVQSRLVEAIGQTGSVNTWLARNGQAAASFLDIRRSLGLPAKHINEVAE